jgi:hypothetical protein
MNYFAYLTCFLNKMVSVQLRINRSRNQNGDVNRTAYGLSPFNGTNVIIFGGYDQAQEKVKSLTINDMMEVLIFESIINTENFPKASQSLEVYVSVSAISIVILASAIIFRLFYRRNNLKPEIELPVNTCPVETKVNTMSSCSTDCSTKEVHNRITDFSDLTNATTLMTNGTTYLSPDIKNNKYESDFIIEKALASR